MWKKRPRMANSPLSTSKTLEPVVDSLRGLAVRRIRHRADVLALGLNADKVAIAVKELATLNGADEAHFDWKVTGFGSVNESSNSSRKAQAVPQRQATP